MSTNTVAIQSGIISRLQIKETIFLLSGSIILQFVVHLIPSVNNIPAGAYLLAMFYAPLLAAMYFKRHVSIVVGALTPLANYLLTGLPLPQVAAMLTVELLVFAAVVSLLLQNNTLKKASAALSFLCAKSVSFIIFSWLGEFYATSFLQSLLYALPGISLLAAVNILLLHIKERK